MIFFTYNLKIQHGFLILFAPFILFVCVSSPSLECDSAEEDMLGHSYPCSSVKQRSILQSSSGEERDSFDTSPDLNRTLSDSTHQSTKVHPVWTNSLVLLKINKTMVL